MEFKGTCGDWRVNSDDNEIILDQMGRCVADLSASILISDKHKKQNAKLVAAAPDLLRSTKIGLEALKILGTFLEDAKLEANDYLIAIIKLALKKALGKNI